MAVPDTTTAEDTVFRVTMPFRSRPTQGLKTPAFKKRNGPLSGANHDRRPWARNSPFRVLASDLDHGNARYERRLEMPQAAAHGCTRTRLIPSDGAQSCEEKWNYVVSIPETRRGRHCACQCHFPLLRRAEDLAQDLPLILQVLQIRKLPLLPEAQKAAGFLK